ncbi:MAG: hypothetical protein ACD_37C00134G0007 [uncultured bacterium]|nr:MAG: hypothetical protein ACD_37C00134G0007 [uncultured bacterium]
MKKFKNTNAKPKRVYKKAKTQQFPSNYRIIPEKLRGDGFAFLVGVAFVLASIFVVGLDVYKNYNDQKSLTNEKIKVLNGLVFWENEVGGKSNYRDAYFKLALLNYQLKNLDEASENLDKALILDPNFEKGRELEKILENL